MWAPMLGSIALGLVKGLTSRQNQPVTFNAVRELYAPVKEEAVYRAGPFMAFGNVPYGSTAAMFAADHIASDMKRQPMTAGQVVARFGDVLLGGLLYESAYRSSGIFGAIAAHAAHNMAVGWGEHTAKKMRGK